MGKFSQEDFCLFGAGDDLWTCKNSQMGNENRIREWRDKRELTLEELSERTGISTSYLSRMESGARNVSIKNLEKMAAALEISPSELVTGSDKRTAPMVGYVGAGAEAHLFDHGQGPFGMVDAPDGSTDATVAVEIRGESLGSFFDRWLVFYDDVRDPPTMDLVGKLCVIGLPDGRVLIKKLAKGSQRGLFTLLSQFESPIFDQVIMWAARVKDMRPR